MPNRNIAGARHQDVEACFPRSRAAHGRRLARALVCGLLLGLTAASPFAAAADPKPIALDVTVIGADGRPVAGAEITAAQVGAQSVDKVAESAATTGSDGAATLSAATDASTRAPRPLPPGIYRIDVSVYRARSTSYVHAPEGATAEVRVDLGAAVIIDWGDQDYVAAAAAATDAAEAGNRPAYEAAVAAIDRNIEFRKQANKDLAQAVEQFRRKHGIPADDLDRIQEILLESRAAENAGLDPEFPPGPLAQYREFLDLMQMWRDAAKGMEMVRESIPALP